MNRKLNILYYFAETDSYMHQWQRFHFLDELGKSGHIITVFNPLKYSTIVEANEILPEYIKNSGVKFDVFINPAPSTVLSVQTIKAIKAIGLPSVLICLDNLHAPFIHKDIAPFFDLVWLTSFETESLFNTWGCTTIFQPYAANPFQFKPEYGNELPGIGFVGSLYDDRVQRVNQLTSGSVPCIIYSDMFSRSATATAGSKLGISEIVSLLGKLMLFPVGRRVAYGRIMNKINSGKNKLNTNPFLELLPSVPFDEINRVYSNHALSLNITELRNTFNLRPPVHKLHLRTFEIPMCGGLQIAPYTDELASYFKEDVEIVLCRDNDEFISKSLFYLRPEKAAQRMEMKQNARKRAESEHTWNTRFTKVFQKLFGS